MLKLNGAGLCAAGIDVGGGDAIRGAVVDGNSNILCEREAPLENDASKIQTAVCALARQLADELPKHRLCAVGVAVSGIVDTVRNVVVYSANFDLSGHNPAAATAAAMRLPVQLMNRARAAALNEWKNGAAHLRGNFAYLSFDRGVGAVLHQNGKVMEGENFSAGEIRNVIVNTTGLPGSNRHLPLESCLQKIYARHGATPEPECYRRYLHPCAGAIATLCAVADPAAIVLGGRLKNLGNDFLAELEKLCRSSDYRNRRLPELAFAQSDRSGSCRGAGYKALYEYIRALKL